MEKFSVGDRVHHQLTKRNGVVVHSATFVAGSNSIRVQYDGDNEPVWAYVGNLILKEKHVKSATYFDFKAAVDAAVAAVISSLVPAKSQTASMFRRYGIAAYQAKLADKAKKDAMTALKDAKLVAATYKPGSEIIFEDTDLIVRAETSEPRLALNADALRAALKKRKLGEAVIGLIVAEAHVEAKAAVKIVVDTK